MVTAAGKLAEGLCMFALAATVGIWELWVRTTLQIHGKDADKWSILQTPL